MSKEQAVLAFVAYHISAGRYGVKDAAGERVGGFIGRKEKAQAEADRLIAELDAAAAGRVIVFGGGDTGMEPLNEQQLRGFAADIDIAGHDSLPVEELAALVMAKVSVAQTTESVAPKGDEAAGNGPGDTTGQEAHLIQPGAGEVIGQLAGVVDQGGAVVELKDMLEEQLRQLAMNMAIDGHDTLPVERLVELIQADNVLVSVGAYTVNRERLDHDGESYTYGESIEFSDPAQAEALLKLGAILEVE